jgi:phosphatidylinositol-3-phosphatase
MLARMRSLALLVALAASLSIGVANAGAALPPIKHVWIVVLENKNYSDTFAENSPAPYLSKTMTSQGELLRQYYGTAHNSLPNYITMISGQPPTDETKTDCQNFIDFTYDPGMGPPLPSDGVAHGHGCVYPGEVKTIADQLEAAGLTWKAYQEDMGISSPGRAPLTTCDHPTLNGPDHTEGASASDQYATKHNPFVYFHSIIDRQAACDANVVDLANLTTDLGSASTTPTYSFITPDLCSDGHDTPCVDGRPGGLQSVNDFLTEWIPRITDSPAYKEGGLIITTFDEASGKSEDCCGEPQGPTPTYNGNGGNGGGQIGAVLLSQYVMAGSVNDTPYNHYSLLRSLEDQFGLPHLGYAANAGLKPFEDDVYNTNPTPTDRDGDGVYDSADACPDVAAATADGCPPPVADGPKPAVKVSRVPKKCVRRAFKAKVAVVSKRLVNVKSYVDGRRIKTSTKHKFSVKVKTAKLKKGKKHRFKAVAKDALGRSGSKTVKFRVCR